jgi:hypothetical protein
MQNFPLNILTFPFWWYTVGFGLVWRRFKATYFYGLQSTGLLVFARHLREPLYGDYTRSGIIISFFSRIVLLAFKLLLFSLRMSAATVLFLLYLLVLPFVIIMIVFQLMPSK